MDQETEIKLYKKALNEIIDLRKDFEYTDEWQEAEAYCKSEEIAKKSLEIVSLSQKRPFK